MATRSRTIAGRMKRSRKRSRNRSVRSGRPIQALSPSEQHEALTALVALERMEAFKTALQPHDSFGSGMLSGKEVRALQDVVFDSFRVLDSMLDELTLDPPLACKRGCIHCCYNQVALTEPEAIALGLYLLETRDRQRLEELRSKTHALVENLKGRSWQDIGMARHTLPCLFLENGTCSVYAARPLVCRGWNSIDVAMCQHSNQSGDAMVSIENHAILRKLAESVQAGLLHGATSLNLEAGYLLMARAVSLLLEGGAESGVLDCASAWLRGESFFGRKTKW